jgi:Domain of unknown function (DUF4157)
MPTLVQLSRRSDVKAKTASPALPKPLQDQQGFHPGKRLDFDFSRIPVYPSTPSTAHTQLSIGSFADPAEQEAERISEKVMREQVVSGPASPEQRLQKQRLQTGVAGSGSVAGAAAPPVVAESLNAPGRQLDSSTRAFMEPRFGCNFSQVRVHADDKAVESTRALQARAYTVGNDVVFAAGHYAPDTLAGRKLLAHELAHVVQQSRQPVPVIRRAPKLDALKDYKTKQKVWDDDAKAIDLAITQSPTIAKFPPKKAKQAQGHVDTEDKAVFDPQYTTYATALKEKPDEIQKDLKTVGGFTDRKASQIHLLNHISDVEVLLHEAIHLNSDPQMQNQFGHHLNEGITEHFTQAVLKEQGRDAGTAYPDELAMAEALIADLGEEVVGKAYFQGKMDAYRRVLAALSRGKDQAAFSTWHDHATSDNPKDWKAAAAELHAALSSQR